MPAGSSPTSTPATGRTGGDGSTPAGGAGSGPRSLGLHTSARKLAGEPIGYLDEVEACYGARPALVARGRRSPPPTRRLDAVLPGRRAAARAVHRLAGGATPCPPDAARAGHPLAGRRPPRAHPAPVRAARGRARRLGVRDGQAVVGLQLLRGRAAQPGGHQRRPAGAVALARPPRGARGLPRPPHRAHPQGGRARPSADAGTRRRSSSSARPQCTLAEGLADLGAEVTFGRRPEPVVAEHLAPLGRPLRRRGGGRRRRGGRGAVVGAVERRHPAARRGCARRRRRRRTSSGGRCCPVPGRRRPCRS